MKVHLLSSNHDGALENKWEVPFDPSLREVTVSLSGPAPQIELSDPFGRRLNAGFFPAFCPPNEGFHIEKLLFSFLRSCRWRGAGPERAAEHSQLCACRQPEVSQTRGLETEGAALVNICFSDHFMTVG